MKISLIGMSGSGKTYWSKKLEQKGFKRFCCDDIIEKYLEDELKKFGYKGIADVAKWMGQPFEKHHKPASKKYLSFEKETMQNILYKLDNMHYTDENIVIDTTGSVIYMDYDILKKLSEVTKIVYFHTPDKVQQKMYQIYLNDPKPVIWENAFQKKAGETNQEALARCYPLLLEYRTKKYQEFAEITCNYDTLHGNSFTIENFLSLLV